MRIPAVLQRMTYISHVTVEFAGYFREVLSWVRVDDVSAGWDIAGFH